MPYKVTVKLTAVNNQNQMITFFVIQTSASKNASSYLNIN